jgi:hypothetical protein
VQRAGGVIIDSPLAGLESYYLFHAAAAVECSEEHCSCCWVVDSRMGKAKSKGAKFATVKKIISKKTIKK